METLADFLGAGDQDNKKNSNTSPRSSKLSRREYARELLNSPQYRQSVLDRLTLGELPPALEILLHYYAYGKPTEHVEVRDTTTRLEDLTPEQLDERAMLLAKRARQLREQQRPVEEEAVSVH